MNETMLRHDIANTETAGSAKVRYYFLNGKTMLCAILLRFYEFSAQTTPTFLRTQMLF